MGRDRKSKTLTALLAFFFGAFGVHRFYLGQRGNGIIYILLLFVGISPILGFIDFLAFLFMDPQKFDRRYNLDPETRDFSRESYQRYIQRKQEFRRQKETPSRRKQPRPRHRRPVERMKPSNTRLRALIQTGKTHYDDYDFFEAIAQWEKALELAPDHVAVHFNLACAYSLTEQADKAFFHLDQAVKNGFKDFSKLKNQDALAFLRIQDSFDEFEANGFRFKEMQSQKPREKEPVKEAPASLLQNPDLLEQLKELGELRDRGLLTEEEFIAEKKKLL